MVTRVPPRPILRIRVALQSGVAPLERADTPSSEESKAKQLEHLKIINASQDQQERLLKYSLLKAHKVEVLDTLNSNETTIYASIHEAARAIGCAAITI